MSFSKDKEVLINELSEAEMRLAGFSTAKSSSLQEAEDKLRSHQVCLNFRPELLQVIYRSHALTHSRLYRLSCRNWKLVRIK